jgi:hypothetical protein
MLRPGPLYGLRRAGNHAIDFYFRYFLCAVPWGILLFLTFAVQEDSQGAVAASGGFLLANVFGAVVLLPAAVVANFVAIRIFRTRSWRREPWRVWIAGILGVPLVWGGTLGWMRIQGRPPDFVMNLGPVAASLYGAGIIMLFSNLAILIAWLLPVRPGR